jgi:hypothetical protein
MERHEDKRRIVQGKSSKTAGPVQVALRSEELRLYRSVAEPWPTETASSCRPGLPCHRTPPLPTPRKERCDARVPCQDDGWELLLLVKQALADPRHGGIPWLQLGAGALRWQRGACLWRGRRNSSPMTGQLGEQTRTPCNSSFKTRGCQGPRARGRAPKERHCNRSVRLWYIAAEALDVGSVR